jgi:BirA family biotin operon repressor/biotin-[acetyl-CoA-carboxylase] ligase
MAGMAASSAQAEPLSQARLGALLAGQAGFWSDLRVVAETGSTNEDVLALATAGAPEGLVIAAEAQTAGRGRQGRSWRSVPKAALTFSVLLRPAAVPRAARGWVPLLAGVATATALRAATRIDARLKWPNDVLVDGGKLAGILAEQSGDAIVVGIGINVRGGPADLPLATATSLELHGAGDADRTALLAGLLLQIERWYLRWRGAGGDADASGLRADYLRLSATVGSTVRVELPAGRSLAGRAIGIDETGQLLVTSAAGAVMTVSAGDVIHVR